MCATCGCGDTGTVRITPVANPGTGTPAHDHPHPHSHVHDHPHEHEPVDARTVTLEQRVLAKNDELAERNREWLRERGIRALNLMSAPGAGKTTLLTRTLRDLAADRPVAVVEGDQETALDARRITDAGGSVIQINTGSGCHLDAAMLASALRALDPPYGTLVFVENVGNLVCPALFDLGEDARVVLTSVTEGTDKPLKYPQMFAVADLILLNKTDLAPYVDFDTAAFGAGVRNVNPTARVMPISATTGTGLRTWYTWLTR